MTRLSAHDLIDLVLDDDSWTSWDTAPARDKPRYALAYRGLNSFAVTARDGGSFIFRRDGLWTWKLAGIDLARGR